MQIISGKDLAASIKARLAEQVKDLMTKYGRRPNLVVILVGDDPGSKSYVAGKTKAANVVGIENSLVTYEATVTQEQLLKHIQKLNADPAVDGILVQLPLPKHIDEETILNAISRDKDVDGFHQINAADLFQSRIDSDTVLPCTPHGVIKILESINTDFQGKNVVVLGRSNIVGMPVAKMLLDKNCTVTICHSRTKDIASITSQADILVSAIGRPKFVKENMVKAGATVIDVGTALNPETGKICGDIDFDNVAPKTAFITPVPGGVGPMTIACLMENTINCYINHNK